MRIRAIALLFVCLTCVTVLANADVCGTVSLASLVGTSCTISDKTFDFISASWTHTVLALNNNNNVTTALDLSLITFTPDASDPLAPSFTLSTAGGFKTVSTSGDTAFRDNGSIDVLVTAASGTIIGLGAKANNPAVTSDSVGAGTWVPDGRVTVRSIGSFDVTQRLSEFGVLFNQDSTIPFSPVPAIGGGLDWETLATGLNSSGSMDSMTYTFSESAPVPEPATLVFFGTGFAGLAAMLRRKKK